MALRIKCVSAGVQGKSKWELVLIEGARETKIACSPQNYNSIKNCRASIDRFKKAVQIEFIEDN